MISPVSDISLPSTAPVPSGNTTPIKQCRNRLIVQVERQGHKAGYARSGQHGIG